jgi:hypothetical protein
MSVRTLRSTSPAATANADVERLLEKLRYFDITDQIDTIVNGDGWALAGQREAAWERLGRCLS